MAIPVNNQQIWLKKEIFPNGHEQKATNSLLRLF
jgi:hypothetical protein